MNCPQKSEDCEIGMRFLAAGERLRYVPSAVVYHSVPPHRLERKYFLSWSWDKAQSDFYIGESPVSMKMQIGGVSLVLFRRLVRWTLEWLIRIEPSRRFACKMKVWSLAGTIQAARQLNYKHSSQQ